MLGGKYDTLMALGVWHWVDKVSPNDETAVDEGLVDISSQMPKRVPKPVVNPSLDQ